MNSGRYKDRDNPTILKVGELSTPFSPMDRSCGQKQQNVEFK